MDVNRAVDREKLLRWFQATSSPVYGQMGWSAAYREWSQRDPAYQPVQVSGEPAVVNGKPRRTRGASALMSEIVFLFLEICLSHPPWSGPSVGQRLGHVPPREKPYASAVHPLVCEGSTSCPRLPATRDPIGSRDSPPAHPRTHPPASAPAPACSITTQIRISWLGDQHRED